MSSEIETGFVRQRRNLILMSVILAFVQGAGVDITKLNIFGNELTVGNPSVVSFSLWVALLYWYIRYYQYFRDLPHTYIRSAYAKGVDQFAVIAAFRRERCNIDIREEVPDVEGKAKITLGSDQIEEKRNWFYRMKLIVGVEVHNEERNSHVIESQTIENVTIEGGALIIPKLRALWHVIANTRLFTEYILPFVLPFIPAIITVWKCLGTESVA